jgi:hypothetical protein
VPHLAFHMSVARELAEEMQSAIIDADRGAYYLGSTGPDMHILSRTDRLSSHFFNLDCLDNQDSVELFFEAHEELRDDRALPAPTAAFVAGYVTHLVTDEIWITDIYRPFFGPASTLAGDARANVMDRLLQYDMDMERRRESEAMADIRAHLLASAVDVRVDFLDQHALRHWRDVVADMLARPPSWDFFPRVASRFLAYAGISTPEEVQRFSGTIPELLRETKEHVGTGPTNGFLEKTARLSLKALREYLR